MNIERGMVMWSTELLAAIPEKDVPNFQYEINRCLLTMIQSQSGAPDLLIDMQRFVSKFPFQVVASPFLAGSYLYVFLDLADIPLHRVCYPKNYPKLH